MSSDPSSHSPAASRIRARFHLAPRIRPGTVIKSLLTTMCGGAMLLAAAAVLDPATLQAGSPGINTRASHTAPGHAARELERAIVSMIESSKQVLAVRPRHDDRGAEIVLWLHDDFDPNRINADELALIRHSPLFQTITIYTAAKAGHRQPAASSQAFDDITGSGFIDRWRAETFVQAKVIATGLSDMAVERLDSDIDGERRSSANHSVSSSLSPSVSSVPALSTAPAPAASRVRVRLQYASDQADIS